MEHLEDQNRSGKSWMWTLLILRQLLDFRMKMGVRQVEMKVPSCISEHHSLYKIKSVKAKKY